MRKLLFEGLATACFVVLISPLSALATSKAKKSDAPEYSNEWSFIPGAGYTPETSWMLGALVAYQFKPPEADSETRPSDVNLSGFYTLNYQMMVSFEPRIIFPEESWFLEGNYEYLDFPDYTWGIGSSTRWDNKTALTYRRFDSDQMFLRQVHKNIYIGPEVGFTYNDGLDAHEPESQTRVDIPELTGSEGTELYSIGVIFRLDARESFLTPTRNHFVELAVEWSPEAVSSHGYRKYTLDARKYIDFTDKGRSVLALQGLFEVTEGEIPFLEKAALGGDQILRGFHEGRYRDNLGVQMQAEFRQQIVWRLGATVFGAVGDVWPSVGAFDIRSPKWAAGGGLRFDLNPKDTMNLRIDYGIGPNTSGVYILVGEAF